MIENKKKIVIGIILGIIIVIGGVVYYILQNNEGEYFNYDENFDEENIEADNSIVNIDDMEIENKPQIMVHIAGQIVNPGVISLSEGARIIDAINAAGGTTEEADLSRVNLAYILEDAQKIYIPSIKEKENEGYAIDKSQSIAIVTSESSTEETSTTQTLTININTANEAELQKIPGIGQSIASKIVAYRKENGKFKTIEEIKKGSGIGENKYNSIKNYICVK